MPEFVERTELTRDGLRGPVLPIALGGSILALLLVGAAGSYWADRRSREVQAAVLARRGPGRAGRSRRCSSWRCRRSWAPCWAGWRRAGWSPLLGPSPLLDRSAPWQAGLTALVALAAGLGLLALVAGLRSRAATERPVGSRRGWVALVPWELLLLAAAGGCWLRLRGSDAVTLDAGIAQINLLVVAFPLLFLAGAAVLIVRLLALLLPRLGRSAGRLPPAWYLAARRVTASRVISVILLAAASLPIAMLVYAAALTQTSQYTLDAKAGLINGSTTTVQSVDPVRRTAATDAAGTLVVRYLYGKVADQPDDVTVLAIDPDTFPKTAFWDRRFASDSLDALMAKLRAPTTGGVVPAVAVVEDGPAFPPGTFELGLGTTRVQHRGRRARNPLLRPARPRRDAHRRPLPPRHRRPVRRLLSEMWSRDTSPDRARDAVTAQHARIYLITSQDTVFDVANFLGVSWTFGYLSALAALVGLVAIGGLLLYLETRQRTRTASYALGRRMGLTRATHLRSLLAELGVLLGLAWVIGAGLAWAAVLLVYHRLDIDPTRPPTPLLTVPVLALAGSAVAVAVVVVLAVALRPAVGRPRRRLGGAPPWLMTRTGPTRSAPRAGAPTGATRTGPARSRPRPSRRRPSQGVHKTYVDRGRAGRGTQGHRQAVPARAGEHDRRAVRVRQVVAAADPGLRRPADHRLGPGRRPGDRRPVGTQAAGAAPHRGRLRVPEPGRQPGRIPAGGRAGPARGQAARDQAGGGRDRPAARACWG